jgi:hypothetical protein
MNKLIKVRTWEDCCAEIEGIRRANPAQASNLLFRGLSDSTWELSTTLERRSGRRNFSFKDYYKIVRRIRPEIETESDLRWDMPSFEEISSWAGVYDQTHYEMKGYEYLAHLRHNGFPSPLLDWSRSPYVAAYFAFSGAASTAAVAIYVYLEMPDGVKGGGEGFPAIRTLGQYVRTHKRHFRQQSAYTVCANYQQSDFDNSHTWHFVSHQTVFDMQEPTTQDLLWKIVVPSSERSKVLRLLDEFNLNAYSLFGSEESLLETLAYRAIDAEPPLRRAKGRSLFGRRVKKSRVIPPLDIICRMDEDFAELADRAYWQFETLTLLAAQRFDPRRVGEQIMVIDPAKASRALNYEFTIVTALAQSYIFNVRRMYRIMHGDRFFMGTIDRLSRRSFDAHMREVIRVRDINEHGFDPRTFSPRNRIATPYRNPTTGLEAGSFFQDETGVRYSVPTAEFFMGQLNLTQAHLGVMRMYRTAGPEMLAKRKNEHINRYRLLSTRQRLIQIIASRSHGGASVSPPNSSVAAATA